MLNNVPFPSLMPFDSSIGLRIAAILRDVADMPHEMGTGEDEGVPRWQYARYSMLYNRQWDQKTPFGARLRLTDILVESNYPAAETTDDAMMEHIEESLIRAYREGFREGPWGAMDGRLRDDRYRGWRASFSPIEVVWPIDEAWLQTQGGQGNLLRDVLEQVQRLEETCLQRNFEFGWREGWADGHALAVIGAVGEAAWTGVPQ